MHAGEPGTAVRRQSEAAVLHADRPEQMLREIIAETLSAGALHRLADPIDVYAVIPSLARLENQRQRQCRVLAGNDSRDARLFHVAAHLGIPDVVDEASRVRDQVPQRDRSPRRTQPWLASGIEAFQYLRRGQLRQQPGDRPVERELALLDELHRGGRGDRLGHRGDPEHRVGSHHGALGQHATAKRALIDHAVARRRHCDDTRNVAALDRGSKNFIHAL